MAAKALTERQLRAFLERERRRRSRLAVPKVGHLLRETLDLTARMVPSRAGSLLLDDPRVKRHSPSADLTFVAAFGPQARTVLGASVPAGEGIVGAVYASGEALRIADARRDPRFFAGLDETGPFRTRSLLAVPVRFERRVCGVLELVNRRGRTDFSAADEELLATMAGYVSRIVLSAVDVLKQNALARTDDLTGLRNARELEAEIEDRVRRARRAGSELSVAFLDVDGLKAINDRLGHRAGSETIRRVGRALGGAAHRGESVHRFGGDEFVLIADGDHRYGQEVVERLRAAVADATPGPMRHGGRLPGVTLSAGVATTGRLADDERDTPVAARLLAAADRALYRAKRAGRDRVVLANARDDHLGRARGRKSRKK